MSKLQAERIAKQMIMSGFHHHTFEDERFVYNFLFGIKREALLAYLNSPEAITELLRYVDILAPTRLRAIRNSIICLISPLCRNAIDHGVNLELSFALSDYYINQVELLPTEEELFALARQILLHYYDLVHESKQTKYSKRIASAIRYIDRNLYGPCKVATVAHHVGLEPHYFSAQFTKEVGMSPSKYILRHKLEESRHLLGELHTSVTEVAESLGFSDIAHFSRCFKAAYGIKPSQITKKDLPRSNTPPN